MTNQQYHRRRRALERLEPYHHADQRQEVARLRYLVSQYQAGGLRAKNGRGANRHSSHAAA